MKMLTIRMNGNGYSIPAPDAVVSPLVDDIEMFLTQCEVGETLELEIVEMTQEEYDALPEFDGF